MNMESTITQNGALYFLQHKVSKRRAAFFRRYNIAARNEPSDVGQLTFGGAHIARRLYRDNGR